MDKTKKKLNHIGIIMDGNGRYAKKRGLIRSMGHSAGVENVRRTLKHLDKLGVPHLTLYAFSTENWKRPEEEVSFLMKLLLKYLTKELPELMAQNVKIDAIGHLFALPGEVLRAIENAMEVTKDNTGLCVHFAINYGSRAEIVGGIKEIHKDILAGKLTLEDITEESFKNYLYTKDVPDPDLIIRTGGEMRLSNFLLYQGAYSELVFVDKYWPDFDENDIDSAIQVFYQKQRRFGGLDD